MPTWNDTDKTQNQSLPPEGRTTAKVALVKLTQKDADWQLGVMYSLDNGGTCWQNFTFNERGKKWLTWQLGILGVITYLKEQAKGAEISWEASATLAFNWLEENKGHSFVAMVTHEEYNGVTRAKIVLKEPMEAFNSVDKAVGKIDDADSLPF